MLVCAQGQACVQLGRAHHCLQVQSSELSNDWKNSGNSKEVGNIFASVFC